MDFVALRQAVEQDFVEVASRAVNPLLFVSVVKIDSDKAETFRYRLCRYHRKNLQSTWQVTIDAEDAMPDQALKWLAKDEFPEELKIDFLDIAEGIAKEVYRKFNNNPEERERARLNPAWKRFRHVKRQGKKIEIQTWTKRAYLTLEDCTVVSSNGDGTQMYQSRFDLYNPKFEENLKTHIERLCSG